MTAARELEWTDIPDLVRLETEAFPDDAWSEASWWGELAGRPRRAYLAVEREGELAAYGGIDHGGQVADLMTIAVAPAHRGSGVGGGHRPGSLFGLSPEAVGAVGGHGRRGTRDSR